MALSFKNTFSYSGFFITLMFVNMYMHNICSYEFIKFKLSSTFLDNLSFLQMKGKPSSKKNI